MKRIFIYIVSLAAVLCSCDSSLVMIDQYEFIYSELVLINKSSDEVKVVITGTNWGFPADTITIKPECGLWKYKKEGDFNFHWDTLMVKYGHSEAIKYTIYTDLPYNPSNYNGYGCLYLNDDTSRHQVIEFNDDRRDAVFKAIEERKTFNMFSFGYPGEILEQYTTPGSSETYFYTIFPVQALHEDLTLGAAVPKEADSVGNIQIVKDIQFNPDSIVTNSYDGWSMVWGYNNYYYLEHLQKASLANYGCDFVELTGRSGSQLNRRSGMAAAKVYLDSYEYFEDTEAPEHILNKMDDHAIIKHIEYGNIMILLVESDEDPAFIMESLEYNVYHEYLLGRTDIDYYLISLDESGQFACIATGTDALRTYIGDFENPTIHPILISFTDFSGRTAFIHVNDIVLD